MDCIKLVDCDVAFGRVSVLHMDTHTRECNFTRVHTHGVYAFKSHAIVARGRGGGRFWAIHQRSMCLTSSSSSSASSSQFDSKISATPIIIIIYIYNTYIHDVSHRFVHQWWIVTRVSWRSISLYVAHPHHDSYLSISSRKPNACHHNIAWKMVIASCSNATEGSPMYAIVIQI